MVTAATEKVMVLDNVLSAKNFKLSVFEPFYKAVPLWKPVTVSQWKHCHSLLL
jgi:hypothetical protein